MKQESFKVLEYKRILSRLAEKAGTKLGKELALGLLPVSDSEDVKERLRQTAEAVYVSSTAHPPLGGIKDIRESIKKIGLGAVLDPAELLDILTTMYAMREIKRFFKELEMEAPILKNWARNLEILGGAYPISHCGRNKSAIFTLGEAQNQTSYYFLAAKKLCARHNMRRFLAWQCDGNFASQRYNAHYRF